MTDQSKKPSRAPAKLLSRVAGMLRRPRPLNYPPNHIARLISRFVVNHEHRVVYRPLPKVACTTWKSIMQRSEGLEEIQATGVHNRETNGLTFL